MTNRNIDSFSLLSFLLGVLLIVSAYEVYGQVPHDAAQQVLDTLNLPNCDPIDVRIDCVKRMFRTFDGTCNNLCNTTRGSVGRPLQRFPGLSTPTAFFQPGNLPRNGSVSINPVTRQPKPLTNCRRISIIVFNSTRLDVNNTQPNFTHVTMTWGQFLDHDLTLTPFIPPQDCGVNDEPCPDRVGCIGIDILEGDELSNNQSAQCIPLRRSLQDEDGENVSFVNFFLLF